MPSDAVRFTVGTYRSPGQHGIGKVTVAPDAIVLESWPISRRLLVHTDRQVLYVRARFAPPWWNRGFILHGDAGSYGIAVGPVSAPRLREALLAAGFDVNERTTRLLRFPRRSL